MTRLVKLDDTGGLRRVNHPEQLIWESFLASQIDFGRQVVMNGERRYDGV